MIHTRCPIDGTDAFDEEVYAANFDVSRIDEHTFSARRAPDRVHYRMVRNARTGCLRADPILDEASILKWYRRSKLTYETVASYAAQTYARYLARALPLVPDKRGVLEIGCGNGFFLECAAGTGFARFAGIEPSSEAVSGARPRVRENIVEDVFRPGLFPAEHFSLICSFHVLDHLIHPNECLQECRQLLPDGGVMYWICHDVSSVLARLLGSRCPMIDIEHIVMYDRRTIAALFENNGFEVVEVFGVANKYPLSYWSQLAPLPALIKRPLLGFLEVSRLGRLPLSANLGNMGIVARKS